MQNVRISHKLNVTYLEDHVQRQPLTSLFENVGGLALGGRERRNDAGRGETGEGADKVGVPSGMSSIRIQQVKNGFELEPTCNIIVHLV